MKKRKKSNATINELVCEKMAVLKSNGKYCTLHNYRALLHFIEKHFGVLKASDCDAAAVMRMKNLMAHLSPSTQASYFACLKSIWNYASYIGATGKTEYPFQRYAYELDKVRVPRIQRRTESYLTVSDMSMLYRHWFTIPDNGKRNKSRKMYLGLFLMSYLMNGANVNDIVRMTYNNDWYTSGGKILSFVRHKTADKSPVKVRVPLTDLLSPIFHFLSSEEKRNGPMFGGLLGGVRLDDEESLLRRVMYLNNYASKRVRSECKLLGIMEDVSMTFARHSYSTAMHHMGAPFALVENNLGHSGSGVAFNYIGSFSDSDLFKWNELLIV